MKAKASKPWNELLIDSGFLLSFLLSPGMK